MKPVHFRLINIQARRKNKKISFWQTTKFLKFIPKTQSVTKTFFIDQNTLKNAKAFP